MFSRIEVLVQLDPIHHVCDQFLQEKTRRHTDFSAEASSHCGRKRIKIGVIDPGSEPAFVRTTFGINVSHPSANSQQRAVIKRRKADLNRAGIVEASIRTEIHVQALRQGGQPLSPCGPSKNAGVPVTTR